MYYLISATVLKLLLFLSSTLVPEQRFIHQRGIKKLISWVIMVDFDITGLAYKSALFLHTGYF